MMCAFDALVFQDDDSIRFKDNLLYVLDQASLPSEVRYLELKSPKDVSKAIKSLSVRGAMAIGVAGAYGVLLGAIESMEGEGDPVKGAREAIRLISSTRPTARNLFWALERMEKALASSSECSPEEILSALKREADAVALETIETNKKLVEVGQVIVFDGARAITHCNSGANAALRFGTALSVLIEAYRSGKRIHVYVDETRPLLQGSRITAWELERAGVPYTLITDSMAGMVMSEGRVDLAIVGADRICSNGDTANKVGTYSLAVLANAHGIPFYVAAPSSTIDLNCKSGEQIEIEMRNPEELTKLFDHSIAPRGASVFNPAFDVTPAKLVTGIITEHDLLEPPYEESILRVFSSKD